MSFEFFLKVFFGGLTKGSIYALIALGYTMVYGIVKLINFAHGEIYMIGAFTALILIEALTVLNMPFVAIIVCAVLVAMVSAAAYGYSMEKIAYKPVRSAPRLSALISAIGMSLFLQNYVRLAQTSSFLSFPKILPTFQFVEKVSYLNSSQIIIYFFTVIIMIGLTWYVNFTKTGVSMRALSQDRVMAMLMGIKVDKIISITFMIGSAIAALGGILVSAYIGQINFYMGFLAGIKAFVAAVLGGIGNLPGAVLGSFILGFSESFGTIFVSSDYEDVFAFILLILILLFKPSGILGASEKEKV